MDINIAHFIPRAIHLAILLQYQLVSACENGWTPDPPRRACFKLYNDIRLDWADAKSYCARNGAYLTDMSGFSEQKFINDSVLKDVHIDYGVWLGATDKGWGAKPWKWVNGNKMNIDLFLWRKGNPDNGEVIIETPFKGENCLQMTTESGYRGQLNDYYCKQKLPFVCKNKQMYTVTTTPLIARTTTQQTSRKNSLPEKSGNSEAAVIVISLLASLLLIAVAVTVILILKRRRKNPTMTILYEDTANLSPDEHLYTGLAGTSAVDNGASSAERPPIRTPSANQPLQGHYSEPYLYDRPIENSVSGSQWIGQNNTSLKPEKCRPYEQMDCSKSVDGNPSKPEVKKRHNKGVKGQQLMTSPSGYIDMDRHYEEIVDDHVTSSDPDSRRVKGSLVEKGNGKEANNVNNCEHPPYYLTPKSEA